MSARGDGVLREVSTAASEEHLVELPAFIQLIEFAVGSFISSERDLRRGLQR